MAVAPYHKGWSNYSTNITTFAGQGVTGTNFTFGNNATYGANVSVVSALTHDAHFISIGISGANATTFGQDDCAYVDILTDPAGGTNWSTTISGLVCGHTSTTSTAATLSCWYHFPLFIKSGTSIGIRGKSAFTADCVNGRTVMHLLGNPSKPSLYWCGQGVETLGVNTSTVRGANVDANTTAAQYGAWTTVGTSTYRYGAVQCGMMGPNGNTLVQRVYYYQIGYNSTKLPGSHTTSIGLGSAATNTVRNFTMPVYCDVPAGTVWQARVASNTNTTNDTQGVGIYGVY